MPSVTILREQIAIAEDRPPCLLEVEYHILGHHGKDERTRVIVPSSEPEGAGVELPQRFVLAHTPFYGLGGRLAVLASAIGYSGRNGFSEIRYSWGLGFDEFLHSPPALRLNDPVRLRLLRALPASLHAEFSTDSRTTRDTRKASEWPPGSPAMSEQDVVYISREDFQQEIRTGESRIGCVRRLFRQIVPGVSPKLKLAELESRHHLDSSSYAAALGVHVRHGNGEKYHHEIKNLWGVKPPSADNICCAIRDSLAANEVDSLIVASDCCAVLELIRRTFGSTYRIIGISSNTQPLGSGCSHNESYFGVRPRDLSAGPISNDEQAMAEILCLSKCAALCGGFSHFFEAAIGFSTASEHLITRIDNRDRYTEVPVNSEILAESVSTTAPYGIIKSTLLQCNVLLDGLFVRSIPNSNYVVLYYFGQELYCGDVKEFCRVVDQGVLQSRLLQLRLY